MDKIEIVDRALYIGRIKKQLEAIERVRRKEDEEYERKWRKRKWPFKDRPQSEKPPKQFLEYPSIHGCRVESMMRSALDMLESLGTGIVYLDAATFSWIAGDF